MPTSIRFTYETKGDNFLGTAEIPTRSGHMMRFETLLPMADIRNEVQRFLRNQPPVIAGDPRILANISGIYNNVAKTRARRRLGTAIKMRFGGKVRPYEVAGPAGYAHGLAKQARQRAYDAGNDIGFSLKGGIKKVGRGIGKGAKAVGKGVYKGGKAVVTNPYGQLALSALPGGSNVVRAIDIARGAYGKKGGGPVLADNAPPLRGPSAELEVPAKSSNGPIIAAVLGGGALLFLLAKR